MKVFWLALRDASLSWVYQPVPFELPPTQTGPGPLENPSITEKSPLGARMDEPERFNDLMYWRVPVPPLADDLMVQCEPNNGTAQETINASEEAFNDLNYWRYPPALPTDLGMECDVPRPYSPEEYAPDSPQRPGQHEEEEEDNDDEDDDDYEDNYQTRDDPMGLLSGGAGVRLLGLLGQLSAHLGSSSRFSRAAELLQEDMIRQREHALRVEEERSSVSMDEDGQEHPSEATHAQRIEPLEGSTLQQPEVLSSVGSLLQILQNNEQLQQSPSVPQAPPLVLFDVTDGAEAPPSPASPASVSRLSPPCPSFGLDDAAPSACPICLESIDGSCLDTLLQMPCARQHVFHKTCLLTWLDTRNTCPVCRHGLPEATEAEMAERTQRAQEGEGQ